ncbi:hypothetical protein ArsFIN_47570 (plasmid) [Arsenophonus nasoniae]|uniref:Transposase n=2 Tax=Arsenophonus nasoniae TaxID=638 RepID=D2U4Q7_9GAMM|nr:hypothetical protein ArsFIN_47570 [Arsenophonus nasoniae]CBA76639.1 transposase [Arsenophonus nasoniae]
MDALTEDVKDIEGLNLCKVLVHIIDREGDSIAHMRELSSHGYNFLILGKGGHTVEYQGKNQKLNDVADSLSYNNTVTINYKEKKSLSLG